MIVGSTLVYDLSATYLSLVVYAIVVELADTRVSDARGVIPVKVRFLSIALTLLRWWNSADTSVSKIDAVIGVGVQVSL